MSESMQEAHNLEFKKYMRACALNRSDLPFVQQVLHRMGRES